MENNALDYTLEAQPAPEESTYQLILAMKKARIEKGITQQKIVDRCKKLGYDISLTTVKRVFNEGSEFKRFNYNFTLRPIARVVLDLDADISPAQAAKNDGPAAGELLRAVVEIKEETIADMKRGIQEREAELVRVRGEAASRLEEKERSINHLKEELLDRKKDIVQLRGEVDLLKKAIKTRTIAIVALAAALAVFMAISVFYLALHQ